ncbi:MAG: hypothetical protein IKU24_01920 [Clostridia bacterium]|nr:hypothetical protein [Clostridia bacterium]
MLKKGDTVCYGQSGICKVEGQIVKEIAGQEQEYISLLPLNKKGSTVYVPCGNKELLGKIRKPLSEKEIEEIIQSVLQTKTEWNRDFRKRSEAFKKVLSSSDCLQLLTMVKTIYDHRLEEGENNRRIHNTDDYFLKDAENLVYSEFSFVLNQEYEEVALRIRGLFLKEE